MYEYGGSSKQSDDMFDVDWCSVDDVINKACVIKGIKEIETRNGMRRLVAIEHDDGVSSAFVTGSKNLIAQIEEVPSDKLPMRAMVKCVQRGPSFGFKLFPPSSEVTKDDELAFQQYKRTKFKH